MSAGCYCWHSSHGGELALKQGDWYPGTPQSFPLSRPFPAGLQLPCIRAVPPTSQPHVESSVAAQLAFTELVVVLAAFGGREGCQWLEWEGSRVQSNLLPQV